jgi:MacB-like periplasmic core domain
MGIIFDQYRRFLRRGPLVALLAGIVLAVGFAGSVLAYTAVLAMSSPRANGVRPMNYATIAEETNSQGSQPITWKAYEQLLQSAAWSDPALIAYADPVRVKLSYRGNDREIAVAAVSKGFFQGFSEPLDAGRDFASSWGDGSGAGEIILSRYLAQKLFSDLRNALDSSIILNHETFRVIGVAPPRFSGLWSRTDAWVSPDKMISLEFGVFAHEVQAGGAAEDSKIRKKIPLFYALAGSRMISQKRLRNDLGSLIRSTINQPNYLHVSDGLTNDPASDTKIRFWSHLAFLLSLALILGAGLNYCGLLLAQAPRYAEELHLKRILGARVDRIILERMCGPAITTILAFFVGCYVAALALWILKKHEADFLRIGNIPWQSLCGVLVVEFAIASLWGVLIALLPAVRSLRHSGAPRLGYTSTASKNVRLSLNAIMAIQMGSCVLTCLVAAMIISAVHSTSSVALGFDSRSLTVIETGPVSKGSSFAFSTAGDGEFPLAAFSRLVLQDSFRFSDIEEMSTASCAPLGQRMKTVTIQQLDQASNAQSVRVCAVSQGFFKTIGTPIFEGRDFLDNRFTGDVAEVVINRSLAEDLWSGKNPLHHTVRVEEPAWGLQFVGEVVGVAEDIRFAGLTSTVDPTVFLPLKGNVFTLSFPLYFLSRGMESPQALEEFVRQEAAVAVPSLGVDSSYKVDSQLRQSFVEQEARVWFISVGAAFIAIIAYLGLYGVLIHSMNSRKKEMAIRLCLGASVGALRRMIICEALQFSTTGVIIALLAWKPFINLAGSKWIGNVELSWTPLMAIPLLCLAVAVVISLHPASATARISPGVILKEQ